jgi:division protein CdvB (Snf7/Vps24/ESCRT-III family)
MRVTSRLQFIIISGKLKSAKLIIATLKKRLSILFLINNFKNYMSWLTKLFGKKEEVKSISAEITVEKTEAPVAAPAATETPVAEPEVKEEAAEEVGSEDMK